MAVAVTTSTSAYESNRSSGGSGPSTTSITTSGDNRGLIVFVASSMASGLAGSAPTGVTYDGTAMTAENNNATQDVRITAYSLINPTTGTNDLVVTWAADTLYNTITATISFSGVSQSDMASGVTATTGSSTNTLNRDITSTASDSIVVSAVACTWIDWANRALTVGAGESSAGGSITNTDFSAASYDDAEEDLSTNLVWTWYAGASCAMTAFSVDGPAPTNFAAVNGIAIGSIEAVNGIANSNIQEINDISNKT